MKPSIALSFALICAASPLSALAQQPASNDAPTVVVGTFDSRGVLMAYVRSEHFGTYLSAQQADVARAIERARSQGDDDLAVALEAIGPSMQRKIHEQGFGTAPIDDIMSRIADRLPSIAEESGVDIIVSRWEVDYFGEGAPVVDLTERIAAEFDPTEATLRGIRELVAQPPVSPGEIDGNH